MTSPFDQELARRLARLREQGLYRELRRVDSAQNPRLQIAGQCLLNFSSNDYLGLANEPAIQAAAIEAVRRYGAGAGASRLICGSLAPHHELDETLAAFKGTEGALSFSSGYAAALGAICALLGKDDIIILDKLVHACIVDAARLSGATLRIFAHNDLADLERILQWTRTRRPAPALGAPASLPASSESAQLAGKDAGAPSAGQASPSRALIVTESVFSMDGDHALLREIVALKERYGAWLMVDEAHATGLYGPNRRGLAEELGVGGQIEVQMGTLGKALGAAGGYLCGSRTFIDYLINRARTFIFSTAPVPAAAAAATAAVRFVQSSAGDERRNLLWQRVAEFRAALGAPPAGTLPSAIIPLHIGDETKAVETAAALRAMGIFIPAIRYPTVAHNRARLRLTLSAAHTAADIAQLVGALRSLNLCPQP